MDPENITSIFELEVESVSLTLLAILTIKPEKYLKEGKMIYDFLLSQMKNGQFGNGQCTVLALKAMSMYLERYKTNSTKSKFSLKIGTKTQEIDLSEEFQDFENSKEINKITQRNPLC